MTMPDMVTVEVNPLVIEPDENRQNRSKRSRHSSPTRSHSWLSSLFGTKEDWRERDQPWEKPFCWKAPAGARHSGVRRSEVFYRSHEPFVLEVVPPRQGKGSDKTLGLYLRYRGDSDRVCVRFCLSMLSTVTGGPQQAWRSPGVVTFGKEAVKGSVFTNWGNSSFLSESEDSPLVRCDITIVSKPVESPLVLAAAAAPATPEAASEAAPVQQAPRSKPRSVTLTVELDDDDEPASEDPRVRKPLHPLSNAADTHDSPFSTAWHLAVTDAWQVV